LGKHFKRVQPAGEGANQPARRPDHPVLFDDEASRPGV
jgi:hypothetical protein